MLAAHHKTVHVAYYVTLSGHHNRVLANVLLMRGTQWYIICTYVDNLVVMASIAAPYACDLLVKSFDK